MDTVRIAWGDGEVTDVRVGIPPAPWDLSRSHTYAEPGTYQVVVTGALNGSKVMQVTVAPPVEDDPVGYGLGVYGTGTYGR